MSSCCQKNLKKCYLFLFSKLFQIFTSGVARARGRRRGPPVHRQLLDSAWALLLLRGDGGGTEFVEGVDEVAARTIGAEADRVVGAAQVRLVL